jgi:hypothetical protein
VLLLPGTATAHAQCLSARHAVLSSVVTWTTEHCKQVHTTWEDVSSCLFVFILDHMAEMTAHSNVFIGQNSGLCITLCMDVRNYRNCCRVISAVALLVLSRY